VRKTSFFVWSLISVNNILNVIGRKLSYNKEKHEDLAVASKEKGLDVNADKTKYLVMSREQNAGQNHNIKSDNKSFERVEHFKTLGTAIKNHSSIQEEIKSRLKSGNACCHSVQNLLSSSVLSKNI
jgi:thermostable 8-oxoguanine DNA glycosylase